MFSLKSRKNIILILKTLRSSPNFLVYSAKLSYVSKVLFFGKLKSLVLVNFRIISPLEPPRKLALFASISSCVSPAIKMSVLWWTGCRDRRWVGGRRRWGGRGGWWGWGRGGGGGEGGGGRGRSLVQDARQVAEKKKRKKRKRLSGASLSSPFLFLPYVSQTRWTLPPLFSFLDSPPISKNPPPLPPRDFAWRHYSFWNLLLKYHIY